MNQIMPPAPDPPYDITAHIDTAAWSGYFFTLAGGMAVTLLALALIARHAPPERGI